MPKRFESDEQAAAKLAEELQHKPDAQVECRGLRHAWGVEENFHVTGESPTVKGLRYVRRVLVCMRCDSVRRVEDYDLMVIGRGKARFERLDKVGHHYIYANDYQIPGVPRGVKPSTIILQEQYRRAMEAVAKAPAGAREHGER